MGEPPPLDVEPFSDAKARELIERETGVGDARIDRVVKLCGGYPLFILWLGKSLSQNPNLLAKPGASLTGNSPEWDACVGVLDSPEADEAGATTRAKVLLLALLVPEGRWQRLPDAEQDRLARALAADWNALIAEDDEAVSRGLLRRLPDSSVYVSPQNLERMLLNHFFGARTRRSIPRPFALGPPSDSPGCSKGPTPLGQTTTASATSPAHNCARLRVATIEPRGSRGCARCCRRLGSSRSTRPRSSTRPSIA